MFGTFGDSTGAFCEMDKKSNPQQNQTCYVVSMKSNFAFYSRPAGCFVACDRA